MPRYRRETETGSVQHVISRFVNRQFLLNEPGARAEYLRRVAEVLKRTDWVPLAYALMSSHVHWVLKAGTRPSATFIKPLHVGFAHWLNQSSGRLGPVFADRHRSVTCVGATAGILVAYVHNNPVRAGVVSDPIESKWTSHRFYLGLDAPPSWLDVAQGLSLCGFASSQQGRQLFRDFVLLRATEPRSAVLTGGDLKRMRRNARAEAVNPVELATPTVDTSSAPMGLTVSVIVPATCPTRHLWRGGPLEVLDLVAQATGIATEQMRSRARPHSVSAARRLALLVWGQLTRPSVEMARALGISASAASGLTGRASVQEHQRAASLAAAVSTERLQRMGMHAKP